MNHKNRALTLLFLQVVGFFYQCDLFFDLFPTDQYLIEWDLVRGILNTTIFWLPPFFLILYLLLKRRDLSLELWQTFNVACLGVILLVCAGLVQSILKMVYGAMFPSEHSSLFLMFSALPGQRAFYFQSRWLILGVKTLGLLLVSVGFVWKLFEIRPRGGKIGWALTAGLVVIFVYNIVDELNVLLDLEKYTV